MSKKMKLTRRNEITIHLSCSPFELFKFWTDTQIKLYASSIFRDHVSFPKSIKWVGSNIFKSIPPQYIEFYIYDECGEYMGRVIFIHSIFL